MRLRARSFCNGVSRNLKQAMDFYVLRSADPEEISSHDASGEVAKIDGIRSQCQAIVDLADAPFDRKHGGRSAMTVEEIDDSIAFIKTLNN
jgi:cytochrome c peroxidase